MSAKSSWSGEELEFIKENYTKYQPKVLCKIMKQKFNRDIKYNTLRSTINRKINNSYTKANNLKTYNSLPLGTIRLCKGKFVIIKTENGWEQAGRYYYKKYHGELADDQQILYLDGNNKNFAKENLVAISISDFGTLRALSMNHKVNYLNKGIYTQAMIEIIQTEKLLYKE